MIEKSRCDAGGYSHEISMNAYPYTPFRALLTQLRRNLARFLRARKSRGSLCQSACGGPVQKMGQTDACTQCILGPWFSLGPPTFKARFTAVFISRGHANFVSSERRSRITIDNYLSQIGSKKNKAYLFFCLISRLVCFFHPYQLPFTLLSLPLATPLKQSRRQH
jgi:hypothetical protein